MLVYHTHTHTHTHTRTHARTHAHTHAHTHTHTHTRTHTRTHTHTHTRAHAHAHTHMHTHTHTGELMTTASWIRKFVHSHPDYKHDSVVSDKVTYDLMRHMHDISQGTVPCPELIGKLASRTPPTYKVIDC